MLWTDWLLFTYLLGWLWTFGLGALIAEDGRGVLAAGFCATIWPLFWAAWIKDEVEHRRKMGRYTKDGKGGRWRP